MRRLSRGKAASGARQEKPQAATIAHCLLLLWKEATFSLEMGPGRGKRGVLDRKGSPQGHWSSGLGGGLPPVPFPGEELLHGSLKSQLRSWSPNGQELALRSSWHSEVLQHTPNMAKTNTCPIWQHTCCTEPRRHTHSVTHTTHRITQAQSHIERHTMVHTGTYAHTRSYTHTRARTDACAEGLYYCRSFPRPPSTCPQEEPQPWSHLLREDSPFPCLPLHDSLPTDSVGGSEPHSKHRTGHQETQVHGLALLLSDWEMVAGVRGGKSQCLWASISSSVQWGHRRNKKELHLPVGLG